MQAQFIDETEVRTKIEAVIADLERQLQELGERRAVIIANLKRHRKMLKLALGENKASSGGRAQRE